MKLKRIADQIQSLESQLEPRGDLALRYTVQFSGFLKPDAVLSVRFRFERGKEKQFYRVTSVRHIKENGEDFLQAKLEKIV